MFRLLVLLCAAIFATLLIAGEDKGQLRPGLAAAVASGEGIILLGDESRSDLPAAENSATQPKAMPEPVQASDAPTSAPAGEVVVTSASYSAEPTPAAAAAVPATPAPVFTLSALPTTRMEPAAEPVAEAVAEAEAPRPATGNVWYVTAKSVNVREAATTNSAVLGKLTRGEAVSVSFELGSEWAQVRIEGDGLEGYVSLRFLSPEP